MSRSAEMSSVPTRQHPPTQPCPGRDPGGHVIGIERRATLPRPLLGVPRLPGVGIDDRWAPCAPASGTADIASAGVVQLTPTATISATSAAIANASSSGSPARVRPPAADSDNQAGTPGAVQLSQHGLDLGQARDRLHGQHVGVLPHGRRQHLEARAVEGPQTGHVEVVVAAVLRPVGQHRAVRPHRRGDPRRPEPPASRAAAASSTLRRSSRSTSSRPVPSAPKPSKDTW